MLFVVRKGVLVGFAWGGSSAGVPTAAVGTGSFAARSPAGSAHTALVGFVYRHHCSRGVLDLPGTSVTGVLPWEGAVELRRSKCHCASCATPCPVSPQSVSHVTWDRVPCHPGHGAAWRAVPAAPLSPAR